MSDALAPAVEPARAAWIISIERRPRLVSALAGLAVAAALPPFGVWPLLVALTPLLHVVLRARGPLAAFGLGWLFGLVHFLAGLYWIGIAFFTDAERFGPFAAPAVLALSALLALAPGIAAGLVRTRRWSSPVAAALAFACLFTLGEWVRGHIGGGFPWNLIGYVWTGTPVIQAAAWIGIYGLGLVTVIAATLPLSLLRSGDRRALLAPAFAVLLVAGLWAAGSARVPADPVATVENVRVRLVQGNISQFDKWQSPDRARWFRRHLELSVAPGNPTHVVWPESASPYALARDPAAREAIGRVAPPGGYVLTGGERFGLEQDPPRIWNSLLVIDDRGNLVEAYDKRLLVPFGEYVPLRALFGALGLGKLTRGSVDFRPGPGPRTLTLAGLPPFSPLICYEAIFSGEVVDRTALRPSWLLNITNDAWFGQSSGPYQHLAMAQVRAIEEGLPLLRAANTGISAVIDPYGRMVEALPLNQTGVLDAHLPVALEAEPPFVRLGRGGLLGLAIGALLVAAAAELRARARSG